jgi:putative OPT family oligopeptide transporter
MENSSAVMGLPANAYTELKPGEKYEPVVPASSRIKEVTFRSVFWGLLFGVIFSSATTFLTLKIAQGMEAAIPIAIIAVGMAFLYKRRSTLTENVIIQSIGSAAPATAAGVVFVIPAMFIMGLDAYINFFVVFFAGVVGGFLGITYLIPFRRHYVAEMHGKYPFPEATAGTEVLMVGAEGGSHAKVLLFSVVVGGIYDFLSMTLGAWREVFTTKLIPSCAVLTSKLKMVFDLNTSAAVIGMGYIIGIRYCMILSASSFLSFIVLVPLIGHFGAGTMGVGGKLIGDMAAGEIFGSYVKFIGIGVIAMAAIMGVFKSSKVMVKAIKEGVKEIFHGKHKDGNVPRTELDVKMPVVTLLFVSILVALFVFFRWSTFGGVGNANLMSLVSLLLIALIAFLFTTVAIWCIAVTARNPVSGMTIVTLALSGLAFVSLGTVGKPGMAAVLIIGTIVCCALSVSGQFISDLKVGYWLGATPRNQQRWKFVGIFTGMLGVAAVIMILNKVYGFTPDRATALPAPQANAMAAVLQMVMGGGNIPWLMYGLGAILAILFEMMGIPTLAVGLGMYLPMNLNMSILVGGVLNYLISNSGRTKDICKQRGETGTLIASGFIAGGAVMGTIGAILMYIQQSTGKVFLPDFAAQGLGGNYLAIGMVTLLCIFMALYAMKVKKDT